MSKFQLFKFALNPVSDAMAESFRVVNCIDDWYPGSVGDEWMSG